MFQGWHFPDKGNCMHSHCAEIIPPYKEVLFLWSHTQNYWEGVCVGAGAHLIQCPCLASSKAAGELKPGRRAHFLYSPLHWVRATVKWVNPSNSSLMNCKTSAVQSMLAGDSSQVLPTPVWNPGSMPGSMQQDSKLVSPHTHSYNRRFSTDLVSAPSL